MNFKQSLLSEMLQIFKNTPIPNVAPKTKANLDSLAEYLLNPIITPKALGLTYATIKYWETKGYLILPLAKDADEWRKYSVLELLWFQLLKKIVDMGCNLDKIAPKLMVAYANYKTVNGVQLYSDAAPVMALINGVRVTPLNNFLNHVLLTVIARSGASIQFTADGCQFYFEKTNNRANAANQAYEAVFSNGINLCVSEILFKYVLGVDENAQQAFKIFNKEEMQVIKLLNKGEIKAISIKQTDGKIYQVEAMEKITINNFNKPLNSFITGDYQEVTVKTNNNKKAELIRITKHQFK